MVEEHLTRDARPQRNLTAIRRGAERARDLVDQILTFGRRREGRREHVCIKALVAEAKSLLAPSLPAHVEIKMSETAEAAVVSAEPAQLQQVILNICNNAAQAMDKSGVIEIEIATREISKGRRITLGDINPGRFVVISISDTGRGMGEATLDRIFEPFFTTRHDGNGLGLATARDIVREHNGALQVSSTLGVGTRFDIWLPSVPPHQAILVQHASGRGGRGVGETVLVLETDRGRLLRHEEILAALGYEPVGFTGAEEAAQACAARARFDAALLCHQPGASFALDFAATLRELAPNLPIVLATTSARDLDAQLLAESGVSEVVHHPLTSAETGRRTVALPDEPGKATAGVVDEFAMVPTPWPMVLHGPQPDQPTSRVNAVGQGPCCPLSMVSGTSWMPRRGSAQRSKDDQSVVAGTTAVTRFRASEIKP
jgi:CheY-like chemotaxis protein